jgi:acetyl esterase/lipase
MAEGGEQRRPITRRIVLLFLTIPVVLLSTLIAGLIFPLPYVDIAAALLSGLFVYLVAMSAVILFLSFRVWRAGPTPYVTALLILSLIALGGWTWVGGRSLAFASTENVRPDIGELLGGFSVDKRGPDLTLPYTSHGGRAVTLSIWKPERSDGKAPVLVMTHGGGFVGGSVTEQLLPYARWLANQGYLVIGANYTLSSKSVHAWNIAEGQIACALAWVGEHARDYGGDVSRLGMYGESAGGNLVINASYKIVAGTIDSPCKGPFPKVRAVSAIYPALGLLEAYANKDVMGKMGRLFDEQYLGGTPKQFPDRYASVQSVNAITPNAPPTLIIYGASDHLVPPSGTRTFVAAAHNAGITLKSIEVPFGEHGFDLVSGSIGAQVWRQAMLNWFSRYVRQVAKPRGNTATGYQSPRQ